MEAKGEQKLTTEELIAQMSYVYIIASICVHRSYNP